MRRPTTADFSAISLANDAGSLSSTIFSFNGPTPWFILFVLATTIVVIFGVEKGIEKASRIMMPILAILAVVIAIYSLTIPGAMQGLKYYILPDFSQFSVSTVLGAMGQMFYSMSLAMGIMITYGSYMQKENLLEHSVAQIEIFDTLFAFVAGLMIIPAVFAFSGGDMETLQAGPALTFITLFGFSAMAGTVGAGGLGDIAIRYGYQRYQYDVMTVAVILCVILVQIVQTIGDVVSDHIDHHER